MASTASTTMSKAAIQARERLIIGPYLVAVNIQGIFYGILLAQWWWICVKARRRPSGRMHALLATLVLLNTLQCGCDIHLLWGVVQDFVATDITRSTKVQPTFIPVILMYWIIQCINTIFFAQRCYIATGRSRIIGGILGTLAGSFILTSVVASVVGSMAFLTDGVQLPARKIVITAICFNAFSDIAISGILTWKFAKEELIHFRTVVTRIITFALATATVTTLLNILQALVLILAYKVTTVNVAISLSLPRISSVCVFASVIARDHLTDAVNRSTGAAAVMECFKVQLQNDCVTRIGDLPPGDEKDLPAACPDAHRARPPARVPAHVYV